MKDAKIRLAKTGTKGSAKVAHFRVIGIRFWYGRWGVWFARICVLASYRVTPVILLDKESKHEVRFHGAVPALASGWSLIGKQGGNQGDLVTVGKLKEGENFII